LHGYSAAVTAYACRVGTPVTMSLPREGAPTFVVDAARYQINQHNTRLMEATTELFDRSVRALTMHAAPPRPIQSRMYRHLQPLDQGFMDKRTQLAVDGPGLVVVELFSGIMATTEALLRCGVKVRKVYACEFDIKAREVAKFRMEKLHELYPDLLTRGAFGTMHGTLPNNIELVNRDHIEILEEPDLIVAGFPCQGFSRASQSAQGLRDPRTKLFTDAIYLIQLVTQIHGPCAYLFENVDASDHPQREVRDDFNDVVKGVLGPGFAFDAVAVGSLAHRHRRWWTNLIPGPLMTEMVEKRFRQRHTHLYVDCSIWEY
jgi:hypothetical protein